MSSKQRKTGVGLASARTRTRFVARLRQDGIVDKRVLGAMELIPRHIFVDEAFISRAYEDTALPIGHGQTISQPYVVGLMTTLVLGDGEKPKRVLEIGTGSGYQAAVLSRIVDQVYTLERIQSLVSVARDRFFELKIRNIQCQLADGIDGWPDQAPFDAILVTAAANEIPPSLIDQLAPGGRLISPVSMDDGQQRLTIITKTDVGILETPLDEVRFVPLLPGKT